MAGWGEQSVLTSVLLRSKTKDLRTIHLRSHEGKQELYLEKTIHRNIITAFNI